MFDRLLEILSGREAPRVGEGGQELEIAVAALLVEAAEMDQSFGPDERAAIERLLAERFGLESSDVHDLITKAQAAVSASTQYYPFTREICARLEPEERVGIVEMMWKVAYADGRLDAHEDMLLRQVAGFLHVPDRERGEARKRALAALGLS